VLEIIVGVGLTALVGLAAGTARYVLRMEGDFRALVQNVRDMRVYLEQAFDGLGHRVTRLEQRMDRHEDHHRGQET